MPITLNHSNISVQYSTGSNYIIETVKSDLYVRDSRTGFSSNLLAEPTVSPSITSNLAIFTHSGGAENQTCHTIYFPENTVCDILVVGGGGGGGSRHAGGGGAGAVIYNTNKILAAGTYLINIGKGGTGASTMGQGTKGEDSSISFNSTNIYLAKGGGAGNHDVDTGNSNKDGGSGGGGGAVAGSAVSTNIPSGTYGNAGGIFITGGEPEYAGGGGGGAGAVGNNATKVNSQGRGGNGGDGIQISITGTNVYYGGGGGGGTYSNAANIPGTGGLGGGGAGSRGTSTAVSGTADTGGGGGGGGFQGASNGPGGAGGSGIIIIRVISPTTSKYLFFNYLPTQPTLNYTINFPTRTMVNFINSGDELMSGQYTVSVRTTQTTITPTQGQNLQDRLYFTSNFAIRYSLLNPILDSRGAQWTYSSNNTNVYHMGSVGIGTTSPEYSLDVRGNIFTSTGGYTQSGLTTWSITSDRRIKENIVKASYEKCLENVKNIELYNFNFKDNYVNINDRRQLGFIAQEVQQVYPKAVEVNRMISNNNDGIDNILSLNTTQIKYTLYGAVKNLIEKVENIESKVNNLYDKVFVKPILNTSNITSNIITNTSNITSNTSNITSNTSNITSNTSNVEKQ